MSVVEKMNDVGGEYSGEPKKSREWFRRFASGASVAAGSPWIFCAAVIFLVVWAMSYPLFRGPEGFNTWQLVINTATTIVTFLMVFLIQNTQNRDARVLHMKLDELIWAVKGARNKLVDLENCSDEELAVLHREFEQIGKEALRRRQGEGDVPRVDADKTAENRAV